MGRNKNNVKALVILAAIFIPLFAGVNSFNPQPVFIQGDLDGDYRITFTDCEIALDIALGITIPTQLQRVAGDMNGDGRINSADAAIICGMK